MARPSAVRWVLLVVAAVVCCGRESVTSQPEAKDRGPVWAYGAEVRGDAWFEERDGVAYYQGLYQYWPRLPKTPIGSVSVDSAMAANLARANSILEEARAAAEETTSPTDWVASYVGVLSRHPEMVVRYEILPVTKDIVIEFANVPFAFSIGGPFGREKPTVSSPDSARAAMLEWFWRIHDDGGWVCWGVDYFITVPPILQPKTLACIDRVAELMSTGLKGEALRQAIAAIDMKDTALEEECFVRDLIEHNGR